eukprot:COSAG06_NODE_34998_length_466_cov_0.798365_1_plen_31_part_10
MAMAMAMALHGMAAETAAYVAPIKADDMRRA